MPADRPNAEAVDLLSRLLDENRLALPGFDFHDAAATATLKLDGAPIEAAHIELLKAAQRTHRLAGGDSGARDALLARGYGSAHQVARTGPAAFIADMAPALGQDAAQAIFRRAGSVRATTVQMTASARTLVGSPHYAGSMFSTVPDELVTSLQAIPGFSDMFGGLDYLGVEDCQSVLSPAAYLFDLLRVVNTYVAGETLRQRRPDIYTLELSCDNTDVPVSYIALATPMLEATVCGGSGWTDAYQLAAASGFPFNLPYVRPLQQIRTQLNTLGSGFAELMAALQKDQNGAQAVALEALGLSPEAAQRISTPTMQDDVGTLYGLQPGADLGPLGAVSALLAATGLSYGDLDALLNQAIQPGEPNAQALLSALFINATGESLAPMATGWDKDPTSPHETIGPLSPTRLDRLARFIRLATATGWSFEQLDYVLKGLGASELQAAYWPQLAMMSSLCARLGVTVDVVWGLIGSLKTYGGGGLAVLGDQFDQRFNDPAVLAGGDPFDPASTAPFDPGSQPVRARLCAALGVSDSDLSVILAAVTPLLADPSKVTLDLPTLSALAAFADTGRLLGLSAADHALARSLFGLAAKAADQAGRLTELDLLTRCIQQMQAGGLGVETLDYIVNAPPKIARPFWTDASITALIASLATQARASLLTAQTLVAFGVPANAAAAALAILQSTDNSYVTAGGALNDKVLDLEAAQALFPDLTDQTRAALVDGMARLAEAQARLVANTLAQALGLRPPLTPGVTALAQALSPTANLAALLLSTSTAPATVSPTLEAMARGAALAASLGLGIQELAALAANPAAFGLSGLPKLTAQEVLGLLDFKATARAVGDSAGALAGWLAGQQDAAGLSLITGWPADGVATLTTYFADPGTAGALSRLRRVFRLARLTGATADQLIALASLSAGQSPGTSQAFAAWTAAAQSLTGAIRSTQDQDAAARFDAAVSAVLLPQSRDALIGLAIWILNRSGAGIASSEDLYDYLLVDAEMGPLVMTSPIALAISSVQLYLQRVRLNLEPGATITPWQGGLGFNPVWWEWISSYRVWQANREIFLYPETYIDPTLRIGKSDIFTDFSRALQQSNVTDETVTSAYTDYVNALEVRAALRHCAAFHYVPSGDDPGVEQTYIFARTNAAPFEYYYRTCTGNTATGSDTWSTWSKVNLKIGAPYITPVYAFNRLFIFWIELEQTKSSLIAASGGSQDITAIKGTVKYSFLNVSNAWTPPQTLDADVAPIDFLVDFFHTDVDTTALASIPRSGGVHLLDTTALPWQQIQAVRLPVIDGSTNNPLGSERILLNFGTGSAFQPNDAASAPVSPTSVNPDQTAFNDAVNDFFTRYNTAGKIDDRTGLVQYHPLMSLDWTLTQDQSPVVLLDSLTRVESLPYGPAIDRTGGVLGVAQASSVLAAEYYSDSTPAAPQPPGAGFSPLLNKVSGANASVITVKNQPGWFIFNNGDEAFLVQSLETGLDANNNVTYPRPLDKIITLQTSYPNGPIGTYLACNAYIVRSGLPPPDLTAIPFRFTRLSTRAPTRLSSFLIGGGIDRLLSWDAQQLTEPDFTAYSPSTVEGIVTPPPVVNHVDFDGAFGSYFWEVFFHGPFLVANRLNAALRFDEAKTWFERVFDPTAADGRVWRFVPFSPPSLQDLKTILQSPPQIAAYNNSPFDPDAIAGLRPTAYAKAIAMAYVGNLLDWGDAQFAMDSAEAINEAMMLYALVSDLLGPRPQQVGVAAPPAVKTFDDLIKGHESDIPQFYIEIESMLAAGDDAALTIQDVPFNDLDIYFAVPENDQLTGLWSRVEDRIYKIRHSMNLQGVVRSLPLFAPPIDPRALIAANAAGLIATFGEGGLTPVPNYRFAALAARARGMVEQVTQLGDALLSALEKRDAAQLDQLRTTQEGALLALTLNAKQQRVDELGQSQAALTSSQQAAAVRRAYYQSLVDGGLSPGEILHIASTVYGTAFYIAGGLLRTISSVSYAAPNVGSPFAMTYGGQQIGHSLESDSNELELAGRLLMTVAELSLTTAQYERRTQEWGFQARLAEIDGQQIAAQLAAAALEIEIAQNDLDAQTAAIQNNQQIADILTSKFTSQDLYDWMAGQISGVYFQTFNLASDMVRAAQAAFQYETGSSLGFLGTGYWSSDRRGLTAGHQLSFALSQLEKAYVDANARTLEIERLISLRDLDPMALLTLKATGACTFALSEALFDRDFPGHYMRRIKSVSLSIPAILSPYQGINATLSQQSSQTVLTGDADGLAAITWLLGVKNAPQPPASALATNPRGAQAVALSRGTEDAGVFELDFRDERYLPFEGTGAVSSWRLSLPQAANRFDFASISDVVIRLRYTALDGGGDLRSKVVALDPVKTYAGARAYDMAQSYSQAWQVFQAGDPLAFAVDPGLAPPHVDPGLLTDVKLWFVMSPIADIGGFDATLTLGGTTLAAVSLAAGLVEIDFSQDPFKSVQIKVADLLKNPASLAITPNAKGGSAFDQTQILALVVVFAYAGSLDWS